MIGRVGRIILLSVPVGVIIAAVGCCSGRGSSPATAQGTILDDATIEPVHGATVTIEDAEDVTGAEGAFSLDTRSGGRMLTIIADGYEDKQVNVVLQPGVNGIGAIYLAHALQEGMGAVEGIVVDGRDTPVPGARVRYGNIEAVSKEDGTFALYNLNPGTQVIVAVSGNDAGWISAKVVAGATTTGVTIRLGQTPPGPPPGFD